MFGLYYPEIIKAAAGQDHDIYVYYTDGSIRHYDVQPMIDQYEEFAPLENLHFFRANLTVVDHTVCWPYSDGNGEQAVIDLDPYKTYEDSVEIDDTEEEISWM